MASKAKRHSPEAGFGGTSLEKNHRLSIQTAPLLLLWDRADVRVAAPGTQPRLRAEGVKRKRALCINAMQNDRIYPAHCQAAEERNSPGQSFIFPSPEDFPGPYSFIAGGPESRVATQKLGS